MSSLIEKSYELAKEQYAALSVDVEAALARLSDVALSVNCWQGDDVAGFEHTGSALSGGGLAVTGSYPGRARNIAELRQDLEEAYSLIPSRHRLNLHASYGEFGGRFVDRDAIETEHFQGWVEWAKAQDLKLDFNATCFSHPKASSGFTLSDTDPATRAFWIEHVKRCRMISAHVGRELGSPCLHNLWIPDGSKEMPVDRRGYRTRLREALEDIYATEYRAAEMKDAVEGKLFGIGSEAFVVGSHDFYLGFALKHGLMPCLDLGHYHPTESVADKLSSLLQFCPEVLVHVSRGVRWDSDHVPIVDDATRALGEVIVRCQALGRVHLALDHFDAGMNRVGAWVIGAQATLQVLLLALLEPYQLLKEAEDAGDTFTRLALQETAKLLPAGAVWDMHCLRHDMPSGAAWIAEVQRYDAVVTRKRG